MDRLGEKFFSRDCIELAPDLVGKILVHRVGGELLRLRVTETEAYRGCEDTACHASKGKTARNSVLWEKPGTVYVYLCYGMHWLLNVISGREGQPQGVLIRACEGYPGPGRLTKYLHIGREQNRTSFIDSNELWFEDDGLRPAVRADRRVGIGYASEEDQARLWRFILKDTE